jgi:hypothetical protein
MVLGVDDFKAKLRGGGARPNLFKATINFPGYAGGDVELTSFMCEAAQLPGSTTGIIEVPFRGRRLKLSGDRTFEPWTVTIINDTSMIIRDSMERWMNGINSHTTNTGIADPLAYEADLKVEQIDKAGDTIKTYVLRGCFPTAVSPIDLNYSAENEIERFTVEFQMQYWESNTTT